MITDTAAADWTALKGKIKAKWSRIGDSDLEGFKGNMHLISDKVQKAYGITKEKADQEYKDFQGTLTPVAAPAAVEPAKSN